MQLNSQIGGFTSTFGKRSPSTRVKNKENEIGKDCRMNLFGNELPSNNKYMDRKIINTAQRKHTFNKNIINKNTNVKNNGLKSIASMNDITYKITNQDIKYSIQLDDLTIRKPTIKNIKLKQIDNLNTKITNILEDLKQNFSISSKYNKCKQKQYNKCNQKQYNKCNQKQYNKCNQKQYNKYYNFAQNQTIIKDNLQTQGQSEMDQINSPHLKSFSNKRINKCKYNPDLSDFNFIDDNYDHQQIREKQNQCNRIFIPHKIEENRNVGAQSKDCHQQNKNWIIAQRNKHNYDESNKQNYDERNKHAYEESHKHNYDEKNKRTYEESNKTIQYERNKNIKKEIKRPFQSGKHTPIQQERHKAIEQIMNTPLQHRKRGGVEYERSTPIQYKKYTPTQLQKHTPLHYERERPYSEGRCTPTPQYQPKKGIQERYKNKGNNLCIKEEYEAQNYNTIQLELAVKNNELLEWTDQDLPQQGTRLLSNRYNYKHEQECLQSNSYHQILRLQRNHQQYISNIKNLKKIETNGIKNQIERINNRIKQYQNKMNSKNNRFRSKSNLPQNLNQSQKLKKSLNCTIQNQSKQHQFQNKSIKQTNNYFGGIYNHHSHIDEQLYSARNSSNRNQNSSNRNNQTYNQFYLGYQNGFKKEVPFWKKYQQRNKKILKNKQNYKYGLINAFIEQINLDYCFRQNKHLFLGFLEAEQETHTMQKWKLLSQELQYRGYQLTLSEIKSIFMAQQNEIDPFISISQSHNEIISNLVQSYQKAQQHWKSMILTNWQFWNLREQAFTMQNLDIHRKGYISLQDLTNFINMHQDAQYRNRDIMLIYNRLLEGKLYRSYGEQLPRTNLQFKMIIEKLIKRGSD